MFPLITLNLCKLDSGRDVRDDVSWYLQEVSICMCDLETL